MNRLLPALVVFLIIGGCSADSRIYEVSVKNQTGQPIIAWLCKDGPPVESSWLSPEQLAMQGVSEDGRLPAIVIPAGRSADTGPIEGKFERFTRAWLRVYIGDQKLSRLLAVSRGSLSRADMILSPGKNDLLVDDRTGGLRIQRAKDADQ